MRHAHAVPETSDLPDACRYLSEEGRRHVREATAWLARQRDRPSLIVTSPIARAVQTAEIAAAALELDRIVVVRALTSPIGSARQAADWLTRQPEPVLAVGHEPTISGVAACLTGEPEQPTLGPAQIVAVAGGRVVAASPEVTCPPSAPSSTRAPPSRE